MTDIGRKPAGTGPPTPADGEAALAVAVGAGAVEAGAELWLTGADVVDEAEVGGASPADVTAGEVLECAELW